MQKSYVKIAAGVLSAALLFSGMNMNSFAKEKTDLPSAGIDFILASNGTSVKNIKDETDAKKAEQKESSAVKPAEAVPQKRRSVPAWQRWSSLAACVAAAVVIGLIIPRIIKQPVVDDPPLLAVSPFEDVSGSEDFEKLGFCIYAPEGAENLYYCIYDGEIARIDFTLNGNEYTYEAAKLSGNFSRADGEAIGSASLNAEYNAVLDRLSPESWRAHWEKDGISFYLTNFDGASEETISETARLLMQ